MRDVNGKSVTIDVSGIAENSARLELVQSTIVENQLALSSNIIKIENVITNNTKKFETLESDVKDLSVYCETGPTFVLSNTVVPAILTNNGIGNLTFPANTIKAGDTFNISISGTIQTEDKDQELEFFVDMNDTVHSTTFIDLDEVKQSNPFHLEIEFTFLKIGTGAYVESSSKLVYIRGTGPNEMRSWMRNGSRDEMNTTVPSTLKLGAQWSSSKVNNILTIRKLLINKSFSRTS
jgi:hypothetical protein